MGMMGLQRGRARCYTNRKRVATIARPSHSGKRPSEPIRYRDYSPERAALPLLLQLPLLPLMAPPSLPLPPLMLVVEVRRPRQGVPLAARATT